MASRNVPILGSLVTGIAGYLGSLFVTYLIVSSEIEEFLDFSGVGVDFSQIEGLMGAGNLPSETQITLWFQNRALGDRHTIAVDSFAGDGSRTFNLTQSPIWTDVLYVVVPAVLVGLGFFLASSYEFESESAIVKTAILSTIGFAPTAVAGSMYSIWMIDMGLAGIGIAPVMRTEFLVAIVALPLVFTAIGAFLATSLEQTAA